MNTIRTLLLGLFAVGLLSAQFVNGGGNGSGGGGGVSSATFTSQTSVTVPGISSKLLLGGCFDAESNPVAVNGGAPTISGIAPYNVTFTFAQPQSGTCIILGSGASVTPGTNLLPLNNTWTGTNAFNNTVSGTGITSLFASPPGIGGTAASTGAFTTLSASGAVSGTGFTALLASPSGIGSTAPGTGSFTTLSASSTVSGSGFSAYLASPPAVGATAPAAGTFTNLEATLINSAAEATIASASTIAPATPTVLITGTAAINTMTPPTGCTTSGVDCDLNLIADISTGPFTLGTSGNIAVAQSPAAGTSVELTYRPAASKWYPPSGSGTTVSVNGSSVSNPNFNGTTPAAGASNLNVTFQSSGSSVSAEIPFGTGLMASGGALTYNTAVIPTYDTIHADTMYQSSTNGTTAATSVTPNKVITAYTTGQCWDFVTTTANPVSWNIDGLGTLTLYSADGSTALPSGVILAGYPFTACYDGTVLRVKAVGIPPGLPIHSFASPISLTGQTANISTATLCAASTGACNVAGLYRASFYLASTVSCVTPGSAAIGVTLTYTDDAGTKTAQTVPLDVTGGTSLSGTLALGTTTGNATASVNLWSTGANAIQYSTTGYGTGCTSGTATYSIRASVERLF